MSLPPVITDTPLYRIELKSDRLQELADLAAQADTPFLNWQLTDFHNAVAGLERLTGKIERLANAPKERQPA